MFLMFALTLADGLFYAWFVYPLLCWFSARKYGLVSSIAPKWIGSAWRRRQKPVSETLCFKKQDDG
jgi:hypothetical protein